MICFNKIFSLEQNSTISANLDEYNLLRISKLTEYLKTIPHIDCPFLYLYREVSPIWTHRPDILKINNL